MGLSKNKTAENIKMKVIEKQISQRVSIVGVSSFATDKVVITFLKKGVEEDNGVINMMKSRQLDVLLSNQEIENLINFLRII